jgi:formylglycine-generating enzyme required for sulfatase activity
MRCRPVIWRYVDFDLRISKAGRSYHAWASCALAQDGEHTFRAPFSRADLDVLSRSRQGHARGAALIPAFSDLSSGEAGARLFRAVFGSGVLAAWTASRGRLAPDLGLRLRLHLGKDAEAALWPWEALCDGDGRVLAISERTPLVRFYAAGPRVEALGDRLPLRIAVLAPAPAGTEPLAVAEEERLLGQGLRRLRWFRRAVLERLAPATRQRVDARFSDGAPCHVLHFIGHGELDRARGVGVVWLETADGRPDAVDGQSLAGLLLQHPSLRLVVLNSCDGARATPGDPLSSVAQVLVRHGVPAVVAMQAEIPDAAAVLFSRRLYERLALGVPIEAAVAWARDRLRNAGHESAWSLPVLYLRAEDGKIVHPPPSPCFWAGLAGALLAAILLAFLLPGMVREEEPEPRDPSSLAPLEETDPRCPSPPGLGLSFAHIPAGTFQMGGNDKESRPLHRVTISQPFCLGRYEVTQGQWNRITGDGTAGPAVWTDRLPAKAISWLDADRLVRTLQERYPAAGFRLPTEAEWEYAARAKSIGRFSFGDDVRHLREHGNCGGNADGYEGRAPVGVFRPNRRGLYDVHGNVSEWVQDWFASYPDGPGQDPSGPSRGDAKVRRGGSWKIKPENCGVAKRSKGVIDRQQEDVGLRLVRKPVVVP